MRYSDGECGERVEDREMSVIEHIVELKESD